MTISDHVTVEFDCRLCKRHILLIARSAPPEHGLCAVCSFLEEFVADPAERAAIAARLERDFAEDDKV